MLNDPSSVLTFASKTQGHDNGGASSMQPPASRRILVVDDNEDAAQSTAELLRLLGHEVFVAHEGGTALMERIRCNPDVVLLDISLPDMDGYEVARQMRSAADQQALVLVAVTGWGGEKDRQLANAAGFDLHWVKPVSIDKLKQIAELPQHSA
jgi:CheY-like chemotaxis protein